MSEPDPFEIEPLGGNPGSAANPHAPVGRHSLERGVVKRRLMMDLAAGEHTFEALGRKYGVSKQAVHAFAGRHQPEIAAMVGRLADELVGLWIADKADRLAELQTAAEHLSLQLARVADMTPQERTSAELAVLGEPDPKPVDIDAMMALSMTLARILRMAAEEMGQIPNRAQLQLTGTVTTVRLEGVDLDRL